MFCKKQVKCIADHPHFLLFVDLPSISLSLTLQCHKPFLVAVLTFILHLQIEDMSQQAQMAAAEKFKEPTVNPAADTTAHTTVSASWSQRLRIFLFLCCHTLVHSFVTMIWIQYSVLVYKSVIHSSIMPVYCMGWVLGLVPGVYCGRVGEVPWCCLLILDLMFVFFLSCFDTLYYVQFRLQTLALPDFIQFTSLAEELASINH